MGKVSIAKTTDGVREALVRALNLIGGLEKFISRSDSVLIKPNLNGADVYTDKELASALIEMLRDLGVSRIAIAESTFGNAQTTRMFFNKTGYTELASRCGVGLLNLNESEAVEVPVTNPLALSSIRVAKEVLEADKIINLPNMKVHYATGVSLALKNLKGFLVGGEKRHFHETGLNDCIVDLCNTIRPHLNIVDGISCMERMGPHGGDAIRLDLLIAGREMEEVDCVGCRVMGYDLSEVAHLKKYLELNRADPGEIEIAGETVESVAYPFKKVDMAKIVPEHFHIHDRNACCTCVNAFLISCRLLAGSPTQDMDVFLGSHDEVAGAPEALRIAFGNCCAKSMRGDIAIAGCPPYPFALGESIKDLLKMEE
jgi:uncharacterized protein (DUF362 family)